MNVIEEWRKIVVDGKVHHWYSVSNLGRVKTHLQNKSRGVGKGFDRSYNENYEKILKPKIKKRGGASYYSFSVNIAFPEDFFEDYQYAKNTKSSNVTKEMYVHQLVMHTFRPIEKYPPKTLEKCWDDVPLEAKKYIKECSVINHINHNTEDNFVDNLEYCTPKENSRAAVKHYGGNTVNKSKPKVDSIVMHDPVYLPLLDEYEQIIEFNGKDGEECWKVIHDIMDRDSKTFKEVWMDLIENAYKEMQLNN